MLDVWKAVEKQMRFWLEADINQNNLSEGQLLIYPYVKYTCSEQSTAGI